MNRSYAKRKIVEVFQSDGKVKGRWYANIGTLKIDGKGYNVFLTFLRRDMDQIIRSIGRSAVQIESTPAHKVRIKIERQG